MEDYRTLSTVRPFVADVGSCIYCRMINSTNLGREHVIPHSLGGGIILRNGSCKYHEKMTRHFEEECSNKSWGIFRTVKNLPSYNRKNRPTHLPVKLKHGNSKETREVPIAQYPDIFPIAVFENLPGLMTGAAPSVPYVTLRIYHNRNSEVQKARPLTGGELSVDGAFHTASFIRLTAKIAHGYAITHFGFEFQPLLLDIIEGDLSASGHFIGASDKNFDRPALANRHIMGHEVRAAGDTSYILVYVGLFAGLGAPVHVTIAGAFDTAKPPTPPSWLGPKRARR